MSSRNYAEEVVTSGLGYKVLRALHTRPEKECYPTSIADDIGSSYQSVNNYMKGLRERNLVEPAGSEGKKRFYKINYSKVVDFFFQFWAQKVKSVDFNALKESFEEEFDDGEAEAYRPYTEEAVLERMEECDNPVDRLFLETYISVYLETKEESDLKQMVYSDFSTGSFSYIQQYINFLMPLSLDSLFEITTLVYAYEEMDGLMVFKESMKRFNESWVEVAGWQDQMEADPSKEFSSEEIEELRQKLGLSRD